MKLFSLTTSLLFLLILVVKSGGQVIPPDSESRRSRREARCDFTTLKPFRIDHALHAGALKKVQPEYPAIAKRSHVQGSVKVRILVDRKGNVIRACVLQGPQLLRQAASEAASQWKFKPNFGFARKAPARYRYVESSINFDFELE
ncbi:MAG: energy transducer TonB [Pyrinomonadaceae bacterium]